MKPESSLPHSHLPVHLSLPWATSIQSITPHPTSWRSILILSSHLRLGLPSGLFPSGFPTKTLYTPLLSPIRATRPTHLILFDLITRTILGEEYRSLSSSLCSFHHSSVTSSRLGPNILLACRRLDKWKAAVRESTTSSAFSSACWSPQNLRSLSFALKQNVSCPTQFNQ